MTPHVTPDANTQHEFQANFHRNNGLTQYATDGPVDTVIWNQQTTKILFYLKENYGLKECGIIRMHEGIHGCITKSIKTIVRACTLVASFYSACEKGQSLSSDEIRSIQRDSSLLHRTLDRMALVNIRKDSGESHSDDRVISKKSEENAALLQWQIRALRPDVIVCGGNVCWVSLVRDLKLCPPDTHCVKPGFVRIGNTTLFRSNHPAARGNQFNIEKLHELLFASQTTAA